MLNVVPTTFSHRHLTEQQTFCLLILDSETFGWQTLTTQHWPDDLLQCLLINYLSTKGHLINCLSKRRRIGAKTWNHIEKVTKEIEMNE